MKLLLRLYPRAWRDRYEDEFLGTVEDRDLSLGDTVDIILGAIDARLNDRGCRGPSEVPQPAPHGASPARLAASLLMIAGVLLLAPPIVTHVAILPVSAQIPNLIGLFSLALSAVATIALWSQRRQCGQLARTGDTGLAMVFVSAYMTLVIVAIAVLVAFPAPAWLAVALPLSFNVGWSLVGIAETRRGGLPRLAPLAVGLAGAQGTLGPCLVLLLTIFHGGGATIGMGWVLMANPVLAAAWILLALALWSAPEGVRRTARD